MILQVHDELNFSVPEAEKGATDKPCGEDVRTLTQNCC